MSLDTKTRNEEIVMKLLHYFITEKNYNPVVIHGAKDEIWLENLDGDYKIVRIVSNYIHNDEQFNFDFFKTQNILSKIKKKTLSFNVSAVNIFLNLGENVSFDDELQEKNMKFARIENVNDLEKYDFIMSAFPNIISKTKFNEKGTELFMKITKDINNKNEKDAKYAEKLFKPKEPVVTKTLIYINVFIFVMMYVFGSGSTDAETLIRFGALYPELVMRGEYFRLVTSGFLHVGGLHILFNMYALHIIGPQIESFFGKYRFLLIYFFSLIMASLMSLVFYPGNTIGAGASGAIFGLLGSLLYFGHYNRVYLGNVMRSQIVPILMINLAIGFMIPGINNAAHIGGLIGGVLATNALGIPDKQKVEDNIHGIIITLIFTAFMIYLTFFM